MNYVHTVDMHNDVAAQAIVPLLMNLFQPTSVLDVGCGLGSWLPVFEQAGVTDVLGVDGDYVDRDMLEIDDQQFVSHDLRQPLALSRKFDLVLCLEVAEHLPESSAATLVKTLVSHGDVILFSAAIPNQGGQGHLNEQWPAYWQEHFRKHRFHLHDYVRPKIWSAAEIGFWYRQNMFLAVKEESGLHERLRDDDGWRADRDILPVVHPDCYAWRIHQLLQIDARLINTNVPRGVCHRGWSWLASAAGGWFRRRRGVGLEANGEP